MITLDRLTFSYGSDAPVLKDVSLTLSRGESVCIMGANGCGKSTLARIVAGLATPRSGSVRIEIDHQKADSRCVNPARPVGILFQNPDNQMVAVTVEKEIAFALENAAIPLSKMEPMVSATLAQFGITHVRTRLTTELSGGEKQRVALAAVMVSHPPIIILDEPDSFLDERGKELLNEALDHLHANNRDMVEVRITQYPSVAREYQRLVVMHGGEIVADGEPTVILNNDGFCERVGLKYSRRSVSVPCSRPDRFPQPGSRPASVRLKDVTFGYLPNIFVVRNLSFDWRQGETVGLTGPSGSGKSTIGSLLCGLLQPSTGAVELLSESGEVLDPSRKPGTVVGSFQQPERQFFLPTCADEISFGPKNLGLTLSSDEIATYLELVGLDPGSFASRDPLSLSMGEKRRLAFAAILSMNPAFIVFDEPTCGLDPEGAGRFAQLSKSLREMNVGQLIITHDLDLIKELCARVIHMSGDGCAAEVSPAYNTH